MLRFRHPLLLNAGGQVDALDATAHLVSILTAGTTTLEYLRAEVLTLSEKVGRILLGFVAEHGNSDRAGMHSASSFGGWDSLDAVTARFSLG